MFILGDDICYLSWYKKTWTCSLDYLAAAQAPACQHVEMSGMQMM